jgi:hypothetical protein
MRWNVLLLVIAVMVAGFVAFILAESANTDEAAAPDVGRELPPGYRDWRLISVAHEAGNLNDFRAILGNDVAIKAYRDTVISPYIEQRHSETALQK